MYIHLVYMKRSQRSYRAKLFRNGGSQAVRLPRACRLPGTEVAVRKEGNRLVVEPMERPWTAEFLEAFVGGEEALIKRNQPIHHEREKLRM